MGQQDRICLEVRLNSDSCVETLDDCLLLGYVRLARDAHAGSAQDGQRVGVGFAVGAPGVQVVPALSDFSFVHKPGAPGANLLSVRGADGDDRSCKGEEHTGESPVDLVGVRYAETLNRSVLSSARVRAYLCGQGL